MFKSYQISDHEKNLEILNTGYMRKIIKFSQQKNLIFHDR